MTRRFIFISICLLLLGCGELVRKTDNRFIAQETLYLKSLNEDLKFISERQSTVDLSEKHNVFLNKMLLEDGHDWIVVQIIRDKAEDDKTMIFRHNTDNSWQYNCGIQLVTLESKTSKMITDIVKTIGDSTYLYDLSLEALHTDMYYLVFKINGNLKRRIVLNPSNSAHKVLELNSNFIHLSELALGLERIASEEVKCSP